MTSIGRRYTGSNVLSRAILITQTLSGDNVPPQTSKTVKAPRGLTTDFLKVTYTQTRDNDSDIRATEKQFASDFRFASGFPFYLIRHKDPVEAAPSRSPKILVD